MKLILTSDGLTSRKIRREFLRLLGKPPSESRVLIMHTAKLRRHFGYIREIKKNLIRLGIKDTNIVEANINKKIKAKNYKGFDIFYSCGGNTFHILDRVRKTGFDRFIKNFIKSNRLYIGVSAGSIIVHKTIEIAGYGKHGDKNNIKLRDLRGLDVIKTAILPHYKIKLRKDANNFRKKVEYPVMELRDGQALVIYGKKVKKC